MLLVPWHCGAAQEAVQGIDANSAGKILLINLIEPELTHSHVGYTAFGTYENKISNDWGLSQRLEDRVKESLEYEGYTVQQIQLPEDLAEEVLKSSFLTLEDRGIRARALPLLEAEMEHADADIVVVLRTYAATLPATFTKNAGYGLLTMHGQKVGLAFLYANVAAEVIRGRPVSALPRPRPRESECKLYFKTSEIQLDSFKSMQASDLLPYRSAIEMLAQERMQQDLTFSKLLRGEFKPCKRGPLRPGVGF